MFQSLVNGKLFKFGLTALLGLISFSFLSEDTVETYYSRGFYLHIRTFFEYSIGQFPLAGLYFLVALLLGLILRFYLKNRPFSFSKISLPLLGAFLVKTSSLGLIIVFVFQLLWGLNYKRIPIATQLNIDPRALSLEELNVAVERTTLLCIEKRKQLSLDTFALEQSFEWNIQEPKLRQELQGVMSEMGYPTDFLVRGRLLKPKGALLRISTSGFYLPFTGEGHIDAGLHPLQLPFTLAHEMAHGYGIGDEGPCNFLGLETCKRSNDAFVQYAGYLTYWRYLMAELYNQDEPIFEKKRAEIPRGMRNDLNAIYANRDQYPPVMDKVRDWIYTFYLKGQGIQDGMKSYSRIVLLEEAFLRKLDQEK